jgi:hypothetical protein
MANEHTGEILLTSFIICPIPDLWPAGTQARNNDRRQSLTDLMIWPCAPISIKYRLQSHPSLLRAVLGSAYLAVLRSSALLASVSQGQISSTKAILCLPCTDRSMSSSGLCACTMMSTGIDPPPGACSPKILQIYRETHYFLLTSNEEDNSVTFCCFFFVAKNLHVNNVSCDTPRSTASPQSHLLPHL